MTLKGNICASQPICKQVLWRIICITPANEFVYSFNHSAFFFNFFFKMTSIFHSGLSKDLSLILNDADDFNVIIQVGENKNTKKFRAHSVILRARSPYFKSAFSSNWFRKEKDMIMFNKPNITPIVFEMILK